jgi:hypothetical protein
MRRLQFLRVREVGSIRRVGVRAPLAVSVGISLSDALEKVGMCNEAAALPNVRHVEV